MNMQRTGLGRTQLLRGSNSLISNVSTSRRDKLGNLEIKPDLALRGKPTIGIEHFDQYVGVVNIFSNERLFNSRDD